MSLRQRLFLIVATVMILLACGLALFLMHQAAEEQRNANLLRAEAAQSTAERIVQQSVGADGPNLPRFYALSTVAVTAESPLERVVLFDFDKRLLYEADPVTGKGQETRVPPDLQVPPFGNELDEKALSLLGYTFSTRPAKSGPNGPRMILLARVRVPRHADVESTLFWILVSILAGTVAMIGLIYLAVWRLVLHPVETLAQKVDRVTNESRAAKARAAEMAGTSPAAPGAAEARREGTGETATRLAAVELEKLEQELIQSRTTPPVHRDELQRLATAFDLMAEELRAHRADLHAQIETVVAERAQAQARWIAAERLNATGRLAAGVAHEINNPLGGVRNALRTIRGREQARGEPDAKTLEYLDLMEDGLTRIANIVTDLLGFSRRHSQPEPVDLIEAATASQRLLAHRFRDAQTEFTLQNETGGAVVITAERAKLGQVFLNLFGNGLDAIQERNGDPAGRKITLTVRREGARWAVRVRDTGAGMSAETQAHVTELFFTTKEPGKGTGLGLAVVASIVEDLDGQLQFDSGPEGTTVAVLLPAEAPRAGSLPAAANKAGAAARST